MEVICIEERAFLELIKKVVEEVKRDMEPGWEWASTNKAMELLGIKSKTTLQELRNNGEIRFSQPRKRIILYDIKSINDFLQRNAKEVF